MPHDLDSESLFEKYDPQGVLASAGELPEQMLQAWKEVGAMKLPSYKPTSVVISGMGGSGLGPRILQSSFGSRVGVPIIVSNGYSLPGHVNKKTLVVSVSYSGNTEETFDAYKDGVLRDAQMVVITAGGALGERAKHDGVPVYRFKPLHNPCGQPRMGVGYPIGAIAALFRRFRLSNFIAGEITNAAEHARRTWKLFRFETPYADNPAKQLASRLENTIPLLLGSRFIGGAIHTGVNLLHENSKHFSLFHRLPEVNHHFLEALSFPSKISRMLYAVFFDTPLAKPMVRQRMMITRDIFTKQGLKNEVWRLRGKDSLSTSLELVMLMSAASVYLAILHRLNPVEIPWVDYFKKHLH